MRAGLVVIQFHRTAAFMTLLMIEWIWRTVDLAIGLHLCGTHLLATQSCSPSALCFSIKGLPSQRFRQRRASA
jgi:hypothetical protein